MQRCGFAQSTCAGPCANGTHLCPPAGQFQSPTLTSYSGTWASSCHSIFWNPGLLVESTATSYFRMASRLCFLPHVLDEHWQLRPHWACVPQPPPCRPTSQHQSMGRSPHAEEPGSWVPKHPAGARSLQALSGTSWALSYLLSSLSLKINSLDKTGGQNSSLSSSPPFSPASPCTNASINPYFPSANKPKAT